jgi:hypothetical protein
MAGAAGFDGTRILYAGGTRPDGSAADEIWAFQNNAWVETGRLGRARQSLSAVSDNVRGVWFLAGREPRGGMRYGDFERIAGGKPVLAAAGANPMVDPPMSSAGGVRIDGAGVCLVGGEVGPDRFNSWWCEQPGFADTLPRLDPPRAGLGAARIGRTVYVVGGYGKGFAGTSRAESYAPPG